jgi:hypothetical protein
MYKVWRARRRPGGVRVHGLRRGARAWRRRRTGGCFCSWLRWAAEAVQEEKRAEVTIVQGLGCWLRRAGVTRREARGKVVGGARRRHVEEVAGVKMRREQGRAGEIGLASKWSCGGRGKHEQRRCGLGFRKNL